MIENIMIDSVTTIGKSILQHGKHNDRIYLMKLSKEDFPSIINRLDKLAEVEGYSKIFAKVPEYAKNDFIKNGYLVEAAIPGFFNGQEGVYFLGKYFAGSRKVDSKIVEINKILNVARSKKNDRIDLSLPHGFKYKICDISCVFQMAELYRKVFDTYPFPIFDPQYICKTMDENFIYSSIWKNDTIVALSSCEMDVKAQNVEMTDFATLPEHRGEGLASYLLYNMEYEMQKRNIKTAYTISRAFSYGINIIFAKMGYEYCGTLIKNTNISGNFESMNVWYKFL
ncbi:MAG: putative beta-lysine N-acetyltransferase [Candidatus Methanoperedens sp.]